MPKKKRMLLMLLKGGMSQSDIAAIVHCSKRDVAAASKLIKTKGLTAAAVLAMAESEAEELLAPKHKPREKNPDYLQPDVGSLVERKPKRRKLPIKLVWLEYCEQASRESKLAYSYQTFCEQFSAAQAKSDATTHFVHNAAEKAFIDWAGDVCWVTDRITGKRTKAYLLVICLPCSGLIFAETFWSMAQDSWLKGHMDALEYFGGVPQMLVPDNCGTATDRTPAYVTLVNAAYLAFAEHYGTAVVPARVRKPRDKSLAEGVVGLTEQWIVAPANEESFHTLDELNDFVLDRVEWLNDRPFSDKDGSRRERYEQDEREHMLALPDCRFETYEPHRAKVAPDCHVRLDYMHYSVPFTLIGKTCDIRAYASRIVVACDGEVVAEHPRLRGRKGQYSTFEGHMPPNHRIGNSPWSRERFESWGDRVGPSTGEAIRRMMDSRPVVQQSFVACRNVLGLSKSYAPDLLERACESIVAAECAVPSYAAVKNRIQAIKAVDAKAKAADNAAAVPVGDGWEVVDRAKGAGRVQGADAWRREEAQDADR